MSLLLFFFFKQKTAYEMRISDWSSDVCSSDLLRAAFRCLTLSSRNPRRVMRAVLGARDCAAPGHRTGNAEKIKNQIARVKDHTAVSPIRLMFGSREGCRRGRHFSGAVNIIILRLRRQGGVRVAVRRVRTPTS